MLGFARWAKLEKDFYNSKKDKFDVSKLSDIYDTAKYDAIHNPIFAFPEVRTGF